MSLPKGTIVNIHNIDVAPFVVFQMHPDDYKKISHQNKTKTAEFRDTLLYKVFFHPKNIELIQKEIIAEVFRRTEGEFMIEKQNENILRTIMQHVFSRYIRYFSEDEIKKQIKKLNKYVVDEVVPEIISQIKFHKSYLERTFCPLQIMEHPLSTKVHRTLPSVTSIFHN